MSQVVNLHREKERREEGPTGKRASCDGKTKFLRKAREYGGRS